MVIWLYLDKLIEYKLILTTKDIVLGIRTSLVRMYYTFECIGSLKALSMMATQWNKFAIKINWGKP